MEMRKLLVVTVTNCHQLCQISLLSPNTDQGSIIQRNLVYPVGGTSTVEGTCGFRFTSHFLLLNISWRTPGHMSAYGGELKNKRGRNVVKVIFLRV